MNLSNFDRLQKKLIETADKKVFNQYTNFGENYGHSLTFDIPLQVKLSIGGHEDRIIVADFIFMNPSLIEFFHRGDSFYILTTLECENYEIIAVRRLYENYEVI